MPEKKTKNGQRYKVDGRTFTWTTDDAFDDPFQVTIPLRIKLRIIREMNDRELDADAMAEMLERIIPEQAEKFPDMDTNDFVSMFLAWQSEYEKLSGASLGE